MKNQNDIYKSKHLSIELKIRYFKCFQESIFLYNSSLWTITSTTAKCIDAFHRKQLRLALGFHYTKTISNEEIYKITKEKHQPDNPLMNPSDKKTEKLVDQN